VLRFSWVQAANLSPLVSAAPSVMLVEKEKI